MRILVVGAGAVGGYFGGRLAEAGEEVAFLARGRTLEALRRDGLFLTSPLGDLHLPEVEASDNVSRLGPVDVVLVGVKAWQVPDVARQVAPALAPGGCALPLQNGVDAPAQLAAELGADRVLGGMCKIISQVKEPGRIEHLGAEPTIALGELDDRPSERTERLRDALKAAGIEAEIPASIQATMWEKFLFICAVSGLGAATRVPLGELRTTAETRRLLERSMLEIHAVARARGIPLADDLVARTMAFIDSLPESATASMQRDIMDGRPSELEAQNGAVVRLGRETGVETPVHEFLYHVLLPLENRARSARRGLEREPAVAPR